MSRIGKLPIQLPDKVEVNIKSNKITVKWPKWELSYEFLPQVNVELVEEDWKKQVVVKLIDANYPNFWGLTRALIANMVEWVSNWFKKELLVIGVGYNAKLQWKKLVLNLWYSHPVEYEIPSDVQIKIEKWPKWEDMIVIEWIDKQRVGEIAAKIRSFRQPEPYKGKGIRYKDEIIKLKAWKTAKK